MKNLHVIPTDKSGRVGRFVDTQELILRSGKDIPRGENVNIYITNDELIKEGDWVITPNPKKPLEKANKSSYLPHYNKKRKIVLTTDVDLIADGVQAIDDTFLKWFVNNPDREEVEVIYGLDITDGMSVFIFSYQVILPKEEEFCHYSGLPSPLAYIEKPKQETLEKVLAQKLQELNSCDLHGLDEQSFQSGYSNGFVNGANWKREKTYSEEEAGELVYNIIGQYAKHYDIMIDGAKLNELFEQFKKK
jgi:hypothetical protein